MRHVYHCPLRWADLDVLGHVNNVTYVDYLQEARVDMFSLHRRPSPQDGLGVGIVVVQHDIDFRRPLEFRHEPIRIETWVTKIRAASFTLAYEIVDLLDSGERVTYTKASTLLTPFVFAENRPRRIAPDERALLERFYEGPADA